MADNNPIGLPFINGFWMGNNGIGIPHGNEPWMEHNTVASSTILDVSYGTDSLQNMDVYLPAGRNTTDTKVIILIHGGIWSAGDKADLAAHVDLLKWRRPEYAIFNINYRLHSVAGNAFPTQEKDVKHAVEYIYNKRNDYHISSNFTLLGVSAGAQLALLQAYKYETPVKIKLVVDFYGPINMTDLYNNPGLIPPANIASVVGGTPSADPGLYQQSSPINFVTAANACPTLILQGSADPVVNPLMQSKELRDKLQMAEVPVEYVEYEGKGHGDDWGGPVLLDAFNRIDAFLWEYNR